MCPGIVQLNASEGKKPLGGDEAQISSLLSPSGPLFFPPCADPSSSLPTCTSGLLPQAERYCLWSGRMPCLFWFFLALQSSRCMTNLRRRLKDYPQKAHTLSQSFLKDRIASTEAFGKPHVPFESVVIPLQVASKICQRNDRSLDSRSGFELYFRVWTLYRRLSPAQPFS